MDALAELIAAARSGPSNAVVTRATAPWAYRFGSVAGLGFHVVLHGSCVLRPRAGEDPVRLATGDAVLLAAGQGHVLGGDVTTPAADFDPTTSALSRRTGRLGTASDPDAVLLCGAYLLDDHRRPALLRRLPAVVHLAGAVGQDPGLDAAVAALHAEVDGPRPGGDVLAQALVDSIVVLLLRICLDDAAIDLPARTTGDEAARVAVRAMHADPARPWTVAELAALSGLSRTSFVRRFTADVGEPPLAHLTAYRMRLAARLLRETDLTLASIAVRVGYASEFALGKSFKRHHKTPPGRFRAER